jgi:hypothetical protein
MPRGIWHAQARTPDACLGHGTQDVDEDAAVDADTDGGRRARAADLAGALAHAPRWPSATDSAAADHPAAGHAELLRHLAGDTEDDDVDASAEADERDEDSALERLLSAAWEDGTELPHV